MGKSNKKVKSDRINALRKQYDAFIEEDKKRKERNEYILGRLDKMRYSNAIVPLRHRSQDFATDQLNLSYSTDIQQARSTARDAIPLSYTKQFEAIPSIPKDKVEEALLIKNLSKKFILIPKLTPSVLNYNNIDDIRQVGDVPGATISPLLDKAVTKSIEKSDVDNADWKSKYEILNKLKRAEKEDNTVTFNVGSLNVANKDYNNDKLIMDQTATHTSAHNQISRNACDVPERDVPHTNSNNLLKADAYTNNVKNNTVDTYVHEVSAHRDNYLDNVEAINLPAVNIKGNKDISKGHYDFTTIEIQKPEKNISPRETNINLPVAMDMESLSKQNTAGSSHHINGSVDSNFLESSNHQAYENIAVSNVIEEIDHTGNVHSVDSNEDIQMYAVNPTEVLNETKQTPEDNSEYQAEVINVQDFTPHPGVKLEDGVNINPDEHVLQQLNYDTPHENEPNINVIETTANTNVDDTGISEFEKEQDEMFYSEPPADANYDKGADNVYGDGYSENHNADNAYYESAALENQEPVEINEHEESTQPYDQSYEQQYQYYDQGYQQQTGYTEQPGYELQQQYEQPLQGYEQQEGFEQPQGYEQTQQGYEQQERFEQPQGYEQTQPYQQEQGSDQQPPDHQQEQPLDHHLEQEEEHPQAYPQEQENESPQAYQQEQGSEQFKGLEQKQEDFPTQEQFEQLQYLELNNEDEPEQITKELDMEQGYNVPTENKETENVTETTTA